MRLFLCVCLLQALTSEQDMQAEARAYNQKVLTIIPPASGMVWPDARSLPAMAPVNMSMLGNDMKDARGDQYRWQKEISFQISPAYSKNLRSIVATQLIYTPLIFCLHLQQKQSATGFTMDCR